MAKKPNKAGDPNAIDYNEILKYNYKKVCT